MNTLQNKLTFTALFIILFLDGFGQSVIFPILTKALEVPHSHALIPYSINAHTASMFYALIIGVFFLCWAFGGAVLGDASDSYGRKKCLVICILGMALGNIFIGTSFMFHNIWILVAGRVIVGLTAGSQSIANATIADMSTPQTQVRNTGLVLLAITLGLVTGPAFGEYFSNSAIMSWFTDQTPFYLLAVICIIVVCLLGIFFKDTRKASHKPVHINQIFNIFVDAWQHKAVRKLVLSFLCMFTCWSMYYFYMNIYFVKIFQATSIDITIFMTCVGIGCSIGMALLPRWIEGKMPTRAAAGGSWFMVFITVIATFFSTSLDLNFVIAVFTGMFAGSGFVFILKTFSEYAPPERQGWIMGIFNATWVMATGIIVLFTGWISSFDPDMPFYITFILFVLGFLMFLTLKNHPKEA